MIITTLSERAWKYHVKQLKSGGRGGFVPKLKITSPLLDALSSSVDENQTRIQPTIHTRDRQMAQSPCKGHVRWRARRRNMVAASVSTLLFILFIHTFHCWYAKYSTVLYMNFFQIRVWMCCLRSSANTYYCVSIGVGCRSVSKSCDVAQNHTRKREFNENRQNDKSSRYWKTQRLRVPRVKGTRSCNVTNYACLPGQKMHQRND